MNRDPTSAPPPYLRRRITRTTAVAAAATFSSSTPLHSSASFSIPFSWEKTPGIPKSLPKTLNHSHPNPHLPLPPPLRSDSLDQLDDKIADPFTIALIECAKDPPPECDLWLGTRSSELRSGRGRRFWIRFRLSDLYGSCKNSCSVAKSTVVISRGGAYRIL